MPEQMQKPPYKVGRQWPYENDRRAGRTDPGRIEIVGVNDPRHPFASQKTTAENRASKRARGAAARNARRARPAVPALQQRQARAIAVARAAHPHGLPRTQTSATLFHITIPAAALAPAKPRHLQVVS